MVLLVRAHVSFPGGFLHPNLHVFRGFELFASQNGELPVCEGPGFRLA